jgi:hypothetical protein
MNTYEISKHISTLDQKYQEKNFLVRKYLKYKITKDFIDFLKDDIKEKYFKDYKDTNISIFSFFEENDFTQEIKDNILFLVIYYYGKNLIVQKSNI